MSGLTRLGHLVSDEGILASPASMAAYMIYAPEWSGTCESYIRTIIGDNVEKWVLSRVSSRLLSSWVLTTFLDNGFTVPDLGAEQVSIITDFFKQQLHKNGKILALDLAKDTTKGIAAIEKGEKFIAGWILNATSDRV
ncbi:hypothetical protein ASPWEDRAFT_30463 [Aspergillus wentii DTO 134E9]|uniref:Uncharacterized protein n=1 Tax=Aspergillus wentii DTO 134E9 TaxID=1073089 RepID=A0A1L9REP6_ASPWE|nr:uncharacterized protein ASPWEDRAFT_30463 [Aspergillus wentii DTO 134E9]OJJ33384.1 hypothetical protein ASPWEDRAFT_30463 [Aspergillus wentii DTO 134E9]